MDAKGNIFVCDLVNQEVVQLSPEGKKMGATKVPWPDRLLVNSRTGDFYVISNSPKSKGSQELLKVTGRGPDAKVAVRLTLKGKLGQSLALDESGDIPVLWAGGKSKLMRVEDRGDKLVVAETSLINPDKNAINYVNYGDVDVENELIYVTETLGRIWRYNGDTGEGKLLPFKGRDVAIGPGGLVYVWGIDKKVNRYTRDLKPAPLPAVAAFTKGFWALRGRSGHGYSVPGMDVDSRGRIYISHGVNAACIQIFDANGKLIELERKTVEFCRKPLPAPGTPALVTGMQDLSGSVRVDRRGNVYVLQIGRPKGHVPPKGFEKEPSYLKATGTIHKFGPEGGEVKVKGKYDIQPVSGVLQSYSTPCGPISGPWGAGGSVCHCTKARFDVDDYGQLYVPNAFTYKVAVVDNSDNQILSFGGYGNWDAQGPKSAEPKPEIPLGWPIFAGASDKYIYVGDALNHRVVRVDKVFAAEETCEVK